MTRSLLPALTTNLQQPHVTGFPLVEMQFTSGTVYVCGAAFDVVWNGATWTSVLGLGQMEAVTETDVEVRGLVFTLSGVQASSIALVLSEEAQGRPVIVRFATLDSGGVLTVDSNVWSGTIDTLQIIDGAPTATVRVTAEHRLARWATPNNLRYSSEDQTLIDPTDRFFDYAAQMTQINLVWPNKTFFQR